MIAINWTACLRYCPQLNAKPGSCYLLSHLVTIHCNPIRHDQIRSAYMFTSVHQAITNHRVAQVTAQVIRCRERPSNIVHCSCCFMACHISRAGITTLYLPYMDINKGCGFKIELIKCIVRCLSRWRRTRVASVRSCAVNKTENPCVLSLGPSRHTMEAF
jgi:hypothetical protein